jgi:hypothetical protein
MSAKILSIKGIACTIAITTFLSFSQTTANAQEDHSITVYQYRHVPDDKVDEFVKRETTYWSKVAEQAVKDKKMSFWALLEKMGGYDLPNSSNFLFINTFPDIDKTGEVFTNVEKTAGVSIEKMETGSMSTTTSQFFLHDEGWVQDAKANPATDFNYVVMVYHNTDYADSLIKLENKYWSPFIQKAMDNNQTPQMAWGNASVLAPMGDNIKFTTVSYDLYKTMQDALMPVWDPKTVLPTKGLNMINKLELTRRGISIYRIVKVVSAN